MATYYDLTQTGAQVQEIFDGAALCDEVTQAQYNALSHDEKNNDHVYFITDASNLDTASAVVYDRTNSGLSATNVQDAIDELAIPSNLANNSISLESGFTIAHNESYSMGRLKILNLVLTTSSVSASQTKICTLPDAWKPADETSLNVQWGMSSSLWYAFVGTSGAVYYRPATTSSSTVTIRVFGTYISAS